MPVGLVYDFAGEGLFTGPESSVPIDYAKLQKKKFFTELKTGHEKVLGVLQINWEFLNNLSLYFGCEFQTSLRKFVKTEAF
ncbi:hypothetical protein MTP99_016938 [Tenebrio molitor]|nr:hypothetical protein MTP99_016938 [Tenebrio molitor]